MELRIGNHESGKYSHAAAFALLVIIMAGMILFAGNAAPAQAASKNEKAHAVYDKKLSKLTNLEGYRYADVTGDKVDEALVQTHEGGGSGRVFRIYTYKNGKAKKILETAEYGLETITFYKKSKGLILYGAGHGGEWYEYYKLKNGKFKYLAGKSRVAEAGGGMYNGPWNYYKKTKTITKKQFKKRVNGVKKGKKKKVTLDYSV